MDQVIHRVLWFDRFALDLTRGCLRADEQTIHLRPKTFEVLRHFTQNPGRLVSKQELHEAVWPGLAVTDDSLVQCIRELRENLGDNSHCLIRTLPRRGYVLDAEVSSSPPILKPAEEFEPTAISLSAKGRAPHSLPTRYLRRWAAAAALLLCLASGLGYALGPFSRSDEGSVHARNVVSATGTPPVRPEFKDCDVCPTMIPLPAGAFMMGSPKDEFGRSSFEGLPRRVTLDRPIAVGRFEVTVEQFSTFLAETGIAASNHCRLIAKLDGDSVGWGPRKASFRQPGYDISGSHPVGCVSWHEAQAYAAWLTRRTGKPYRLPTEAEWEYAARAGTTSPFSFGKDSTDLCAYARFADLASPFGWRGTCRSNITAYGPVPVGTLKPNPWGLFDMHGNAWEWVEDCWTSDPSKIPTDGSALARPGECEVGVVRGGSWASGARRVRSASRWKAVTVTNDQNIGFRVALPLNERKVSASKEPRRAW